MPSLKNSPSHNPAENNRSKLTLLLALATALTACAHNKKETDNQLTALKDEDICSDEKVRINYGYSLDNEPGPDFEKCPAEEKARIMARRKEAKERQDQSDCLSEISRLDYGYDENIELGPDFNKCPEEDKATILFRRAEIAQRKSEQAAREEERAKFKKCREEGRRLHDDLNADPSKDFELCTEEEKADILEYREIMRDLVRLDRQGDFCDRAANSQYKKIIDGALGQSQGGTVVIDLNSIKEPKACRKYERMRRDYSKRLQQYFDGKKARISKGLQ